MELFDSNWPVLVSFSRSSFTIVSLSSRMASSTVSWTASVSFDSRPLPGRLAISPVFSTLSKKSLTLLHSFPFQKLCDGRRAIAFGLVEQKSLFCVLVVNLDQL